jgi:hypothetical protein
LIVKYLEVVVGWILMVGVMVLAFVLARHVMQRSRRVLTHFVKSRRWEWTSPADSRLPELRRSLEVLRWPVLGAWWSAMGNGGIHVASGPWRDRRGEVGMSVGREDVSPRTYAAITSAASVVERATLVRTADGTAEARYHGPADQLERFFTPAAIGKIAGFSRLIVRTSFDGRTVALWWDGLENDPSIIEAGLDLARHLLGEAGAW